MTHPGEKLFAYFAAIQQRVERLSRIKAIRLGGFFVSVLLICGGLYWSIRALKFEPGSLSYTSGIGAFGLSLVSLVLSAGVYRHLARSLGNSATRRGSLSVMVNAGVANLLPVPGHLIVRWYALSRHVGHRLSAISNFSLSVLWVGIVLICSAAGFYGLSRPMAGLTALVLGGIGVLLYLAVQWRLTSSRTDLVMVVLLQVMVTGSYVFRLWLISGFLGIAIDLKVSAVIAVSALAGAVSGIMPAGLGVVEALGALLAVVVEETPQKAFVILVMSRCMTILSLLGGLLYLRLRPERVAGVKAQPHRGR